jgi:hypothetical protein
MKTCQKCNIEKNITEFSKNKNKKDGLGTWCRLCVKEYKKEYYINNKEKILKKFSNKLKTDEILRQKRIETSKKWREENKEIIKIKRKEYRLKNKEKINKWREENKERIKILRRNYRVKNLKNNMFMLKNHTRNLILKSLKRRGYTKKSKSHKILGCSYENFIQHIESQFEGWMNWGNKGLYNGEFNHGWDIDHIIPLSSAKTEEDIIKLNHYTNLRPLCSKINRDIKRGNL